MQRLWDKGADMKYSEQIKALTIDELITTYSKTKKVLLKEIEVFFSPKGIRMYSDMLADIVEEMNRRKV